ncbi:hypothetical protein FACS1894111_06120 [Clostridia bacterium]|nr:hypothetical protein FACS1894111_06120 [Clostridia bacterium]
MKEKYKYLTMKDRIHIAELYLNEERTCDIAERIGVHAATIYIELKRGQTGELDRNKRLAYNPEIAQRRVQEGVKRRGKKRA